VNLVLMDTRRHKTVRLPALGAVKVIVPCEIVHGRLTLDLNAPFSIEIADVEFTHQGDYLRGDPIYLQTRGPELPESWWYRL
jgi:hypothetical protein